MNETQPSSGGLYAHAPAGRNRRTTRTCLTGSRVLDCRYRIGTRRRTAVSPKNHALTSGPVREVQPMEAQEARKAEMTRVHSGIAGPFQLDVIAKNTVDVVASAGGFLCDCALTGWRVRVFLVSDDDTCPLRILGAKAFSLDCNSLDCQWPTSALALSVSAELFTTNAGVRDSVINALRSDSEVTLWGKTPTTVIGAQLKPVRHQITRAGLVFKSRALDAAARPHHKLRKSKNSAAEMCSSQARSPRRV
jgi:hypothetical protein